MRAYFVVANVRPRGAKPYFTAKWWVGAASLSEARENAIADIERRGCDWGFLQIDFDIPLSQFEGSEV